MLVVAMVVTYLPTDMTEVMAENTSVSFSLASATPQDTEGRYLITLNVSGVSIPNYSTDWENIAYIDGVEKIGTGDTSGFAYVYVNESQMYMLLKYDYVQSGASASSAIGSHQFIIPEGTVIPFGGVTMELSKDFVLDINGSTVTESTTSFGTLTYQSGTAGNHDGADDCCYINMSISGVSNTGSGWYGTNTIEVDGIRVSSGNIYYVASNGTDVTLRIRYSAIKEALGVDSLTGSHTVAIPRYVLVPNAGGDQGDTFINKEKVSFQVDFDNNTVTEIILADVTHNSYTLQRSAIEDNADANSWFRFTSATSDSLTSWATNPEWTIVDGGFCLNGEEISADLVEFISIGNGVYHVGLSALLNAGNVINSGDYITLNAMVQDTTDSGYYVKFETVYFQYDTNGDQKWTIQTEEPGNKDVQFALTSAGAQDGDGRYLLTVSVSGATLPEHSTGWDNTALLDGVEKTGTGENSGFAYSYVNSSTMNILLKYDYVEAGATTASTIGKHRFVIPKGTVIPFGTITMELSEDFDVTIQGDSVIETPQADVTHNSYTLQRSAIEDNADANSWFRFTSNVSDTLEQRKEWSIVDGGFSFNGETISADYVEFIKITDTIYHIGLSALLNSGVTIESKDYITLNAMVQDTTDSGYYVKFETVYFQYDTNGDKRWTVQTEEPYIGIPEPSITHTCSSIPDAYYGGDGTWLRFHVDTSLDTLSAQSKQLVILDGGLYKNGTLLAEDTYDIQKPWNDGYHIGLNQGKLTFAVGDRLTMDVLVVAADDTTAYHYPIKFEVTFECTASTDPDSVGATWSWTVIDVNNDMSFIRIDTKETVQRESDGTWLIYLYTNRSIAGVDDEVATITAKVGDVTYTSAVPMYRQSDSQRMLIALSQEQLSVNESGAVEITIPKQPNIRLQSSGNIVNIANAFTFYLYSNGSFGLLGDSDGTSAGNVNGDDVIGSQDLVCLKKYLADHTDVNHTEHTLKSGGADANGNGYIEETDIIKLYEYILEGWTVDGMSYEAGTQLPVYLDDEDIQLAAYQGPRTLTIDGTDDLTSIEEEFRKYKEAGFNTIIHEADCAYSSQLGSDMWYKLKQYMRKAQKYDLDVLISSQELNDYLLNGNEGTGTEDTANWKYSVDRLIDFMLGQGNNNITSSTWGADTEVVIFDNFAGFVMADEPDNESAIMERYKTAKAYIDEEYSEAFGGRKPVLFYSLESYESELFTTISGLNILDTWITEKKVTTDFSKHSTFLANYGNITGSATVDRYPFRIDDEDGEFSLQDPDDGEGGNYLDAGWLYQLELLATQGKANGFATGITLQSTAFTHPSDARRKINSVADVKFEVYSALAYGMHSVNYFTYNLPTNPPKGETFSDAMADDNTAYTAVQTVNNEISKFDYVFNDYDWVSTKHYGSSSDGLFDKLASNDSLPNITSVDATNAAIVSHMKDYEKYLDGYWVVNVTDPEDNLSHTVTVTFDTAYTKAIVFVDGEKKIVNLTNGVYEANLEAGEGVFIIPLKIAQ